jgi:hypothetical protein
LGDLAPYLGLQRPEFLPELFPYVPDIVSQVNASILPRAW